MKAIINSIQQLLLFAVLGALALAGLEGCEGGTSSETVGIVEATPGTSSISGRTDAGNSLGLYSIDFEPQSNYGFAKTVSTDSNGAFRLTDLPKGVYRLIARNPLDGKAALIDELVIPSLPGHVQRAVLESTGTVSGIITDSLNMYLGWVYLPGTPFFAFGDSLMHYSIKGVPAGNYRAIRVLRRICPPPNFCGGSPRPLDSALVRIKPGESVVW